MTDRILTTHAGSLPRPARLVELFALLSRGEAIDTAELDALIDGAVAEVIAHQHGAGIDIGNDGEQARESFFTYVQHRMSGFEPGGARNRVFRDIWDFPGLIEHHAPRHLQMRSIEHNILNGTAQDVHKVVSPLAMLLVHLTPPPPAPSTT